MGSMKNKAEVVQNNENSSEARGQSQKLKLKFQIHQIAHCMTLNKYTSLKYSSSSIKWN